MNAKELKELISSGESSTLEFKRKISSNEKIAKEISAFANTIGGKILLGVDDDGTIIGAESEKGDIDSIETICEFYIDPPLTPKIEIVQVARKDVIVIHISKGPKRPHKVVLNPDEKKKEKHAYIRVGDKSLLASREMARVLAAQNPDTPPLVLSIGEKEKRLFDYLNKNERASVKDFARLVNISVRRSEQLMVRLVRAGVLQIHNDSEQDYFTLISL